jgi:hypothetical protein
LLIINQLLVEENNCQGICVFSDFQQFFGDHTCMKTMLKNMLFPETTLISVTGSVSRLLFLG